ncbi:MAG TPA: hypothetical protein PLU99_03445 [Phycisphaerae bacterium]|jgi:hypothetical protein|nr:hypothetical protein [Phycisphaerae bacterium]HRT40934.1 hypothetical protein [Phycisphaerae bacterium]
MMKLSKLSRLPAALSATLIVAAVLSLADDGAPGAAGAQGEVAKESKAAGDLVPLNIKLPKPAFRGTPKHVPPGTNLEEPRKGPRPPFMAAKGAVNVAAGKPVTSSDSEPIIGSIKLVTDGDNSADEGSYVELGPGLQWVQIDLKEKAEIWAILVWHYHANARVYHDVVVQIADDPDFITNVRTLFNNDHDNSSGLGLGRDKEYWETYEGKLIEGKAAVARYVRLYSKGSTADDQNHYIEVEVYARPAK